MNIFSDKMAANVNEHGLQLYLGVLNNVYTLQDFIEGISNNIENNRVKSYLQNFLQKTQELEQFYNLKNQYCSPRTAIQSGHDAQGNPFIFQYFIRKIPSFNHYCMYISIPANHPLYGRHYDEVQDATYSCVDAEDNRRWVFGWDYTHFNMLTFTSIYMHYTANPASLLDMQIISIDTIERDISRYIDILAGNR